MKDIRIKESIYDSEKLVEWGGFLNEFLWICAGVDRKVLRQCPTDYAKYAGIGGTILFTALMAMLSGGYAFCSIFDNLTIAILFGVFWGLLIFNLDRFMVNTMYSDGKHTISKDEFLGGLPRIILAIFIGIVISTPIELRIFDDRIQSQLLIDQGKVGDEVRKANQELYNHKQKIEDQKRDYESKLSKLNLGGINAYTDRIIALNNDLKEAQNNLYKETNGTGVTRVRGYGPAAQQLRERVDYLINQINEVKKESRLAVKENQEFIKIQRNKILYNIDELDRQLREINDQIKQRENERNTATTALSGFTAKLKALFEITDYSVDSSLFLARIMIMLLFIAIEVIPTLFKMMMTAGPYDNLLKAEIHRVRVLSEKRISDVNDSVNTSVQISVEKNKERLEAELAANKLVMEKLAVEQAKLLETAIEDWSKEEMEKVKSNPSAYIQTTNSTNKVNKI